MKYDIEMFRCGPGQHVRVTFADSAVPSLGVTLQDESGCAWRVIALRKSEVELRPLKAHQIFPKMRSIVAIPARVQAA